jgi:serine/threonine protein kinase
MLSLTHLSVWPLHVPGDGDPTKRTDLKPANIFLMNDGSVKLGDLGLSRFFSSKTHEVFSLVGTPWYMSPEAIMNEGYSFESDVWSFGCFMCVFRRICK